MTLDTTSTPLAQKRKVQYILVFLGLIAFYSMARHIEWQGTKQLHTILETIATFLSFMVGVMALIRYYSKRENTFLLIGAGFLGVAFLDGYHAIVTSTFFDTHFPSPPASLIPWSWIASRAFLSIMMAISYLYWRREKRLGVRKNVSEKTVYACIALFTLVVFLFFIIYPLPRAYYPELYFGRPGEFIPALFFLIALVGYIQKGQWKISHFEHWLVISLIIGFVSQAIFMPLSFELFDFEFDTAHMLKKASYICVLIGLMTSMYGLLGELTKIKADKGQLNESEYAALLAAISKTSLVSITDVQGNIVYANNKFIEISQYTMEELLGKNHRILKSGDQPDDMFVDLWKTISSGNIWQGTLKNRAKDGSIYWVDASIAPIKNSSGVIEKYVAARFLITDKKEMEYAKNNIEKKVQELEKVNNLMIDREITMRNMKKELEMLQKKPNST